MIQESVKSQGQVRVENYRLSIFHRTIHKLLNYLGAVKLAVDYARTFGALQWDTGFNKNTITNVAFAVFAGLAGNTGSQTAFGYIGVGTSTTAPAASQTTLGAEIVDSGLARAAASVSRVTTTQTNDTLQLLKSFSVSGTKTVEEAGVFNASSNGTMAGRALTTSKPVVNGDTLVITYQIKFS